MFGLPAMVKRTLGAESPKLAAPPFIIRYAGQNTDKGFPRAQWSFDDAQVNERFVAKPLAAMTYASCKRGNCFSVFPRGQVAKPGGALERQAFTVRGGGRVVLDRCARRRRRREP